MAPKQDTTVRPFGLSDAEMKVSLCVLRLLAIDGNTPIDKVALAKLTGHEKPNSAIKIWSMAKVKLTAADEAANDPEAPIPGDDAAPINKPNKRGRKPKAGGKKAAVPGNNDEDIDELELDEPTPKRANKKEVKQEAGDDSV